MEIFIIGLLLGGAVAGIVSLTARIPILRHKAQDSKAFRYGLMASLGGLMVLITIVILGGLSLGVNIGVALFYNDMAPEPFLTEEVRSMYENEFAKLWQELSLRLIVPSSQNHCFQSEPSSSVCTAIDRHLETNNFFQLIVWVISLFFGYITGAFTAYHTRDRRKQKQKAHELEG